MGQPGILILSLPYSMTLFIYDWPLLRRAGRLQRQAFGLLPEPTLFLLRVIAACAFQDNAPDRVLLVAAMGILVKKWVVPVLVCICGSCMKFK
jgi:hypothetical protein